MVCRVPAINRGEWAMDDHKRRAVDCRISAGYILATGSARTKKGTRQGHSGRAGLRTTPEQSQRPASKARAMQATPAITSRLAPMRPLTSVRA